MTRVKLWRCVECGKWSHAKRKPKEHQRFIPDDGQVHTVLRVISEREAEYDMQGGLIRESGVMAACGPFHAWTATRDGATA